MSNKRLRALDEMMGDVQDEKLRVEVLLLSSCYHPVQPNKMEVIAHHNTKLLKEIMKC